MIHSGNSDLYFLQETKLVSFDNAIASNFWGTKEVEWTVYDSLGGSGGMEIMWKEGLSNMNYIFRGECFIGIGVVWKGLSYNFINIYASCLLDKRRKIWRELVTLKGRILNEEWCLKGDFNSISSSNERKGRDVRGRKCEINGFKEFILNMNLIDVSSLGKRFTWFNGDGTTISRLDKFLLFDNMVNSWKIISQLVGKRDILDHFPIWLKYSELN